MVTVRQLNLNGITFVRAYIRRSYGMEQRPAYVKFNEKGVATSGFCTCAVGRSGLCSHAIAVLMQLVHITDHGEPLLEVSSTDRLQKWHKKSNKSTNVLKPLNEINVSKWLKIETATLCIFTSNYH